MARSQIARLALGIRVLFTFSKRKMKDDIFELKAKISRHD